MLRVFVFGLSVSLCCVCVLLILLNWLCSFVLCVFVCVSFFMFISCDVSVLS